MTQPTIPANSSDASSPQDNAWNCLLALETQMLLERLPPTPFATSTPPTPSEMNPAPCFDVSAAPHTKIPHPALPDTYDGDQAGGERFLQSCVTYIQLSGEAFTSDALKISW
ncbi:hypothetical protein C0995_010914, partial [Termitomyces sp. Mi166